MLSDSTTAVSGLFFCKYLPVELLSIEQIADELCNAAVSDHVVATSDFDVFEITSSTGEQSYIVQGTVTGSGMKCRTNLNTQPSSTYHASTEHLDTRAGPQSSS